MTIVSLLRVCCIRCGCSHIALHYLCIQIRLLNDEMKQQVQYAETEIARLQKVISELQQQLSAAQSELPAETLEKLRAVEMSATQTETALVGERESLRSELRASQQRLSEAEGKLKFAEDEGRAAMVKIRELQIELEAQAAFVHSENVDLHTSNDSMRQQLTETTSRLQEAETGRCAARSMLCRQRGWRSELDHECTWPPRRKSKIHELEVELHHQVIYGKEEAERMWRV